LALRFGYDEAKQIMSNSVKEFIDVINKVYGRNETENFQERYDRYIKKAMPFLLEKVPT